MCPFFVYNGSMTIEELQKRLVFTPKDALKCFNNDKILTRYWIKKYCLRQKTIKRLRQMLYAVINPATGKIYADKFTIGSNIFDTSYLAYHSALEYHGLANKEFDKVLVVNPKRFSPFIHDDITFEHTISYINIGVDTIELPHIIRVTDLERTIIDCIDQTEKAGGLEQLAIALFHVQKLDVDKLLKYLRAYNIMALWQKTAYLLENFNSTLNIGKDFFDECKKNVSKRIIYFFNDGTFGKAFLNKTWNVIAPRDFTFRQERSFWQNEVAPSE